MQNDMTDRIQRCSTVPTPETIKELLAIMQAMNEKVDALERDLQQVHDQPTDDPRQMKFPWACPDQPELPGTVPYPGAGRRFTLTATG